MISLLCSAGILQTCVCAGRSYEADEEVHRKNIFASNLKHIEMHNYLHSKGLKSFRLGVTQFADLVSFVETLCVVGNIGDRLGRNVVRNIL